MSPKLMCVVLLAGVTAAGCTNSVLEARVAGLEADLRASRDDQRTERVARLGAQEQRLLVLERSVAALESDINSLASRDAVDVSVPAGTTFPVAIDFLEGDRDFHGGDGITITVVRGTTDDFAVGSYFLVRGRYTLASRDSATLSLTVTGGATKGNPAARKPVTRGSGDFELLSKMPYPGYPHVTFRVSDRPQPIGGVYFGKGASLMTDKGRRYE